jgi:hypothetical protein
VEIGILEADATSESSRVIKVPGLLVWKRLGRPGDAGEKKKQATPFTILIAYAFQGRSWTVGA